MVYTEVCPVAIKYANIKKNVDHLQVENLKGFFKRKPKTSLDSKIICYKVYPSIQFKL